ncbi:hypothetical protein FRB90_006738 [Tulasnella sp. 427]|nr:hypothetical protein FRB90_006738 [Tulasnella sp. 427]
MPATRRNASGSANKGDGVGILASNSRTTRSRVKGNGENEPRKTSSKASRPTKETARKITARSKTSSKDVGLNLNAAASDTPSLEIPDPSSLPNATSPTSGASPNDKELEEKEAGSLAKTVIVKSKQGRKVLSGEKEGWEDIILEVALEGPKGGAGNSTYSAAYIYFEKMRISEGSSKSKGRLWNEKNHPGGFKLKTPSRWVWVRDE